MPRLAELENNRLNIIAMSVGGSALYEPESIRINCDFLRDLVTFCKTQVESDHRVIAITGGGKLARALIERARKRGVIDQTNLDQIGIWATKRNARILLNELVSKSIPAMLTPTNDHTNTARVDVGSGTDAGHTTDLVAIIAAQKAGVLILFNIGMIPGLHPVTDVGIDTSKVIESLTFDKYLTMFPGQHTAGENIPIDREAVGYAKTHHMTIVLVPPSFDNLEKCLDGEKFIGTILHP